MSSRRSRSTAIPGRIWLLCLASAGFAIGCAPAIANITRPAAGLPVSAAPDEAAIVVIQPSTYYQAVTFLDGHGKLLGQLHQRSHTILRVPPGPVRLYAYYAGEPEWGDRIEGEVAGGRVYYATISIRHISVRSSGVRFNALHPGSPDDRWAKLQTYLSRAPRVEMDPARVAGLVAQIGDTAEVLRVIDALVDPYPPEQIELRTIRPEYGF